MRDRRLISGNRVACLCSLQLPKVDAFDNIKIKQQGCLVFNTRGGSFYLKRQFTEHTILKLFRPDEASLVKDVRLYPENQEPVSLGDLNARFIRFRVGDKYTGMVLRFSNQTEKQLDMLNNLVDELPAVVDSEDPYVQGILDTMDTK